MRICAAVPCFNGERTLASTLESLLGQTRQPDEILVVDDGSHDGSRALAQRYPVNVCAHASNRGLAAARNSALEATTCDVILYVDADARADAALVETIERGFAAPGVVGVGGRGIEANIQSLADRWRALHAAQGHGLRPRANCSHLFGLCMAYRRRSLEAAGGFDLLFRTNAEDMDIGFRLTATGSRLAYDPAARVFHQRQDSEDSLLRTLRAWYYWAYIAKARNRRRPWTLWAGTLRRAVTTPLGDLLVRADRGLARLGMRVTAAKLSGLGAAAADWRAGDPGRQCRCFPGRQCPAPQERGEG